MSEPHSAHERTKSEEHAERVRDAFRRMPGFLASLKSAQDDIQAGRVKPHEEVMQKYPAAE
jgi:hypothetical protein